IRKHDALSATALEHSPLRRGDRLGDGVHAGPDNGHLLADFRGENDARCLNGNRIVVNHAPWVFPPGKDVAHRSRDSTPHAVGHWWPPYMKRTPALAPGGVSVMARPSAMMVATTPSILLFGCSLR